MHRRSNAAWVSPQAASGAGGRHGASWNGSDLVFPSARGRPLSDATISKMVRELGIGGVPHGFRSSFRDWAAECSDAPREVCELALAHVNSDRVEAADRRTDLFERRRGTHGAVGRVSGAVLTFARGNLHGNRPPDRRLPSRAKVVAPILPESPIRLRAMHHPLDLHNVARRLINEQHPPVTDADAQRIAQSFEADPPHGRFFNVALDPSEHAETRRRIQPFEVAKCPRGEPERGPQRPSSRSTSSRLCVRPASESSRASLSIRWPTSFSSSSSSSAASTWVRNGSRWAARSASARSAAGTSASGNRATSRCSSARGSASMVRKLPRYPWPDRPRGLMSWAEKRETARRVRQRISAVMRWAVAQGYREDNPAGDAIGAALPKTGVRTRHQPALPYTEVRGSDGEGARVEGLFHYRAHLRFPGAHGLPEWRGARRAVGGDGRCGPGMAHSGGTDEDETGSTGFSLSTGALAVLGEARALADGSGLVFPSARGRPLSDATISKMVRELAIPAVPHGFRESFRDWAAECSDAPREVCELALAHVNWTGWRLPTGGRTCSSVDANSWKSGPRFWPGSRASEHGSLYRRPKERFESPASRAAAGTANGQESISRRAGPRRARCSWRRKGLMNRTPWITCPSRKSSLRIAEQPALRAVAQSIAIPKGNPKTLRNSHRVHEVTRRVSERPETPQASR